MVQKSNRVRWSKKISLYAVLSVFLLFPIPVFGYSIIANSESGMTVNPFSSTISSPGGFSITHFNDPSGSTTASVTFDITGTSSETASIYVDLSSFSTTPGTGASVVEAGTGSGTPTDHTFTADSGGNFDDGSVLVFTTGALSSTATVVTLSFTYNQALTQNSTTTTTNIAFR
jgi:hypothetical protein